MARKVNKGKKSLERKKKGEIERKRGQKLELFFKKC